MNSAAHSIAQYIHSVRRFDLSSSPALGSEHIGAFIAEAIMQPGESYKIAIRPLIERLIRDYPEGKTSGHFARLLEEISPKYFLNWKENDKPRRVLAVAKCLHALSIETADELRFIIDDPDFIKAMKDIRGIGNRQIDYLKLLLEIPSETAQEYMNVILKESGVSTVPEEEISVIWDETARLLQKKTSDLLLCVWRYLDNQ